MSNSFAYSNTFSNDHTNNHKITLAQNNNAKAITLDHTYSKGIQQFTDRAYYLNSVKGIAFCYLDYPLLSPVNFRRITHELGDNVERVGKGRPQLYKLKGIQLPGDTRKITLKPMRVEEEEFVKLLESLKDQPAKIHDIKIRIDNSELHKALLDKEYSKDPHNHSIKDNFETIENNITTKILIYPKTIQVDLGCTYRPLVYDIKTIWYLHEHLSKVSYHLAGLSDVILPPVNEWVFTHYHFGKDGTEEYNGQNFNYTIEDVNTGFIRFYSKLMKDGKRYPRLERIQTPHTTFDEEMKRAMFEN